MGTNFTQGEWKIKDNGHYLEVRGQNSLKPVISVFPFMPPKCSPEDYCDEKETLANAKLIAASPDLYNASLIIINRLQEWEPGYKELNAAIKKATE